MIVIHRRRRITENSFRPAIYGYFRNHGRIFPWRRTKDPYRILISEIMLQQTQVLRVLPKYKLFLKTFPNFKILANSSLRDVLLVWQGLGYNRRAKYLKEIAEAVIKKYNGVLPEDVRELEKLPGIGPYTARAIAVFAFGEPHAFLETNIRAVLLYFFFRKRRDVRDKELLQAAWEMLDRKNPREWHFALMDYGAMLKETAGNPNRRSAHYKKQSRFEGSDRQIRGLIIKALTERERLSGREIQKTIDKDPERIEKQLQRLLHEQMISKYKVSYSLQ